MKPLTIKLTLNKHVDWCIFVFLIEFYIKQTQYRSYGDYGGWPWVEPTMLNHLETKHKINVPYKHSWFFSWHIHENRHSAGTQETNIIQYSILFLMLDEKYTIFKIIYCCNLFSVVLSHINMNVKIPDFQTGLKPL
jgi:hypothetical protein